MSDTEKWVDDYDDWVARCGVDPELFGMIQEASELVEIAHRAGWEAAKARFSTADGE